MLKKLMIFIMLICFVIGCSPTSIYFKTEQDFETIVEENKLLFDGLTQEQKIEDYEYMWKTLRVSYPFFGVVNRLGIDVDAIYSEYEEKITESHNDVDFLKYINDCMNEFTGIGHLGVIDALLYEYIKDIFNEYPMRESWDRVINNPRTKSLYSKLLEIEEEYGDFQSLQSLYRNGEDNVITEIIVPGKVAYIKIKSFLQDFAPKDYETLINFYREVSGYENLIIDVTDNSGGSDDYWMRNIVSPLIEDTLTFTAYMLFSSSSNNDPYLQDSGLAINSRPIAELPYFDNINEEDLKQFTNFFSANVSISPAENRVNINGRIWTLVNRNVYSASESFTQFCKATGFSTIVGENTGGDGIGIDPVYLILPNSGIAIRYSMLYGLNLDGSSNQEFGTTPDFISPDGEPVLDTCLKLIEE